MAATVHSAPDADAVATIAALDNPVLRNFQITQCYAQLSEAMAARTNGLPNWCTFATWASRQAGATIRGEDFVETLARVLGEHPWVLAPVRSASLVLLRKGLFQPNTRLGRLASTIHTPFDAFERASTEVARGNLKVFAEIGAAFARFLATVPLDAPEDSPEFASFAAGLRPGRPPDGQDLLRDAFADYQRQRREPDAGVRAAWILLGNLKIGLHEQTRLQPQIAAAVQAPLVTAEDLGDRVLQALFPSARRWPRAAHDPLAAMIGWIAARVRRDAITATQEAVTRRLMVLTIPGASGSLSLALGRDIDAPVPAMLRSAYVFLDNFVKQYDPCAPGGTGCGATNWCDLGQRMHYIVHLFRAYAADAAFFSAPFTPADVASVRRGVIPRGES
jgi:hypothetical protein